MNKEAPPNALLELRKEIDQLDQQLVELLARRFQLTHEVGILKADNGLEAVDADRESQKLARIRELCQQNGVNPGLGDELFSRIMKEVVRNHHNLKS